MNRLEDWDVRLSAWLALPRVDRRWPLAARIAHLGDAGPIFLAMALIYLVGWLADYGSLRLAIAIQLMVLLATALVIFIIKYTLRRERPSDPGSFVAIQYDKFSFPSGHSARVSCLAVSMLYFNLFLGLALLLIAFMVGAARVIVGVHYVGDVVVGLALGAVTAIAVINLFNLFL